MDDDDFDDIIEQMENLPPLDKIEGDEEGEWIDFELITDREKKLVHFLFSTGIRKTFPLPYFKSVVKCASRICPICLKGRLDFCFLDGEEDNTLSLRCDTCDKEFGVENGVLCPTE